MISTARFSTSVLGVAVALVCGALPPSAALAQVAVVQQPFRSAISPDMLRQDYAPKIELTNATPPAVGRLVSLSFKISGLKGARAVHLYRFTPGCNVERQLGISGLPIRLDTTPFAGGTSYTTDNPQNPMEQTNFRDPITTGLLLDANGEARLAFQGVIGVSGGGNRAAQNIAPDGAALQSRAAMDEFSRSIANQPLSCTPSAAFVFLGADRKWRTLDSENFMHDVTDRAFTALVIVQGQPWIARPRRLQTVISTRQLRDLLAPAMPSLAAGSACSGLSVALGQPNHLVGPREKDGDLTFSIRSGPAGTRCGVLFNQAKLPAGVTVVKAKFTVETVGSRCRVGNTSLPLEVFERLGVFASARPVLGRVTDVVRTPESIQAGDVVPSASGWLDPFRFPEPGVNRLEWQAHFAPMGATLSCDATAVNDHGVTLRFDSAQFLVPDGVDLGLPVN